jgi:hypothetical protein
MAEETLIEGYCERCLEDDFECRCLCETMEWCIECDCHCILRNAVGKEDLDRIDTYLEMLSKGENVLTYPSFSIYDLIVVDERFVSIINKHAQGEIHAKDIDLGIKNTFQWKCYLIFKKHKHEYVF